MLAILRSWGSLSRRILTCFALICSCCLVINSTAQVTNQEVIQRADQLPYFDETITMQADGVDLTALWQPFRTPAPQGTVVLIHDSEQNSLWPDLLQKLRLKLPDNGWNTLTLTSPVTYSAELMQQVRELLASRGQFNVVMLGIGSGADNALTFVQTELGNQADFGWYLVMINNRNRDIEQLRRQLQDITVPVLDVWVPTAHDSEWLAKHRLAALRRSGSDSVTQIQSAWPAARQHDRMDHLARRVWGWIRNNAAGREADVQSSPRY